MLDPLQFYCRVLCDGMKTRFRMVMIAHPGPGIGFHKRFMWQIVIPPTPAAMSKLGLEGCNLCCQLGDVLLSGHGGVLAWGLQGLSFLLLSGWVQDQECMRRPGTCGALTYLQGVTQGEQVPAECLSRSVIIMYESKYIHRGLYLSRSEKKAAFSSYSSPALYNGQVMWRKELNKKAVTHY